MTAPVYDLLVVLHVLSAVIGFGSVGVSGAYAARGRSSANPRQDATLVRYFHPGTNWAERTLLVTPVLGAIVLFAGDRSAASEIWPWIGLGAWTCAAAMATAWCWPAERRIQAWLSGDPLTPRKGLRRTGHRRRRRRAGRRAAPPARPASRTSARRAGPFSGERRRSRSASSWPSSSWSASRADRGAFLAVLRRQ